MKARHRGPWAFVILVFIVLGSVPAWGQAQTQGQPQPQARENYPPEGWLTDFGQAREQAARENKKILMNFTGSDWCGWCFKLRDEVFETDAFKQFAREEMVLLFLDFPGSFSLPRELQEQNQLLSQILGVQGFPTIYVLDPDLTPRLKTGYTGADAKAYGLHLSSDRNVPANLAPMLRGVILRNFPQK